MGMESAALLGTGILSNVFTSALTDQYNQDQFNRNLRLQKDAQAYNTTMYVRQRDDQRENYQTMLADQRANYNTMRSDMENFYNKYQTPTAMAKQLRASGINPAAVLGSGQGIQAPASMPAMSSPQMSSPSASSSPLASLSGLQNPYQNYATLLPQVTSALKDISSSGLQDAQTQEVQTLLQSKLHKLMADIGGQEALNTQLQLENEITKAFGKKKAAAEIKSLTQQAFLYAMSGKTEKAKAALTSIQEQIGQQNLKIDTERALVIAQLLKKQLNFIDEQTNTEKAKQRELGASAQAHVSQASYFTALKNTEDKLRDGKFEALSLSNDLNTIEKYIMGNEYAVSDATTVQRIDALFQQFYREGIITQQAFFDYKQAKKWDDKERFIRYVGSTVHAVNEASQSVTTPYGVVRNADIRDEFNKIYERSRHGSSTRSYFDEENGWTPISRTDY